MTDALLRKHKQRVVARQLVEIAAGAALAKRPHRVRQQRNQPSTMAILHSLENLRPVGDAQIPNNAANWRYF
jgi:hypothetical protein